MGIKNIKVHFEKRSVLSFNVRNFTLKLKREHFQNSLAQIKNLLTTCNTNIQMDVEFSPILSCNE